MQKVLLMSFGDKISGKIDYNGLSKQGLSKELGGLSDVIGKQGKSGVIK